MDSGRGRFRRGADASLATPQQRASFAKASTPEVTLEISHLDALEYHLLSPDPIRRSHTFV
jgi:hypothetical protein